jgi:hypothetical protein
MIPEIASGLFALAGVLIGGLFSWWLQKGRAASDLAIALEAVKTEHMAEKTAQHFLNHKGYRDRSFVLLSKRLGGFEDNELRKILVRAGAVRYMRADGTEWWRLLSRRKTEYEKTSNETLDAGNEDL